MTKSNKSPVEFFHTDDDYDDEDDVSIRSLFSSLDSSTNAGDDTPMDKSPALPSPLATTDNDYAYPLVPYNAINSEANKIDQNKTSNILIVKPKSSNYFDNLKLASPAVKETNNVVFVSSNNNSNQQMQPPPLKVNFNENNDSIEYIRRDKVISSKLFINKSEPHFVVKNQPARLVATLNSGQNYNYVRLVNKTTPTKLTTFPVNKSATLIRNMGYPLAASVRPYNNQNAATPKIVYMSPPSTSQVLLVKTPQHGTTRVGKSHSRQHVFSFPESASQPSNVFDEQKFSRRLVTVANSPNIQQYRPNFVNHINRRPEVAQATKPKYLFPVVDNNAKIIYGNSQPNFPSITTRLNSGVRFLKVDKKRSFSDFNYSKVSTPYFSYRP